MKDYILKLSNTVIDSNVVENENYNIALLKEIIAKVSSDKNYFHTFLLDISDDMLTELVKSVDIDEQQSFLASLMYLKNLIEINKTQGVEVPLSENQNEILYTIYDLIKRLVDDYEGKTLELEKKQKLCDGAASLKNRLIAGEIITIDDYNLIEKLIYKYETGNVGKILNEVMSFLNSYNYELFDLDDIEDGKIVLEEEAIVNQMETEEILPVEDEEVDSVLEDEQDDINEESLEEEPLNVVLDTQDNSRLEKEEESNVKITQAEKDIDNDLSTNKKEKYEQKKYKPSYDSLESFYDLDIFTPQSFEIEEVEEKNTNKARSKNAVSNNVEHSITDLLLDLDINVKDLTPYAEKLLIKITDFDKAKKTAYYIKNYLMIRFNPNNINGIITVLCLSDVDTLESDFNYFKQKAFSDEIINNLLNRATEIFLTKNKDSFKDNFELALSYSASIERLVKTNITFFFNSYEYNKNKINLLEDKGININLIFEFKPQLLAIGLDKLLSNIDVLMNYGYDLEKIDYDSISIIGNSNLNLMIDLFIETGFSEYIFMGDSLKNTRSLIIKRLFYAHKNDLSIWSENFSGDRINLNYEEIIVKERKSLSEEDISYLVADYDILETVEFGKRGTLFSNTSVAQLKRKYEFRFNNIVLSRLKTYSVFKVLVSNGVNEKDALFYALIYNSNLEIADYNLIKNEILGK